jgi:hypothetical protein
MNGRRPWADRWGNRIRSRVASWVSGVDAWLILEEMFEVEHRSAIHAMYRALDDNDLVSAQAMKTDLEKTWGADAGLNRTFVSFGSSWPRPSTSSARGGIPQRGAARPP